MRQNIAFIFLLLLGIGSIGASSNNVESDFWSHRFAVVPGIAYGEHPSQIMDGYLQGDWVGYPDYFKATVNPRPTLIWIHGGGWVEGNQRGNEPFFQHFLQNGWNVFSITYRLGPGTAPVAVDDAVCALKHVVDQSSEWPIDRNMIVIAGGSAGGHLALTTGILGSRPGHACYPGGGFKVAAIVNWFGITDIEKVEKFLAQTSPGQNYAATWIGDTHSVADISKKYSPVNMLDSTMPPVMTIHGDADTVVTYSQATALHQELDVQVTANELLMLPGGKHLGFSDAQFQQIFRSIFAFLDRIGISYQAN